MTLLTMLFSCCSIHRDVPDGAIILNDYPEISGDPSVLVDNAAFTNRMFYTSPNIVRLQGAISQSVSDDLVSWQPVNAGMEQYGRGTVLVGLVGQWHEQLETAYCIEHLGTYYLYYCGYPNVGWPTNPGKIGVATSADGLAFTHQTGPILDVTPDKHDANGLYSPVVIRYSGEFLMVYAAQCYASATITPGFYIMAATSADGLSWTKDVTPVLSPDAGVSYMVNGVAEPDLILGPDGKYYLFFTGNLGDTETRCIAVARATSPLGPYTVGGIVFEATPDTFNQDGVLAPTVIVDGSVLKMWYLTSRFSGGPETHSVGYTELAWPLSVFP